MELEKNIVLVTWDFTEKSEFALEHAILAANKLNHQVGFVHIVKKDTEMVTFLQLLQMLPTIWGQRWFTWVHMELRGCKNF
jgi:hypothetical protein